MLTVVVVHPVELNDKTMINVTSHCQFSKFFINFNQWESLRCKPPVATWLRKSPIFGEGLWAYEKRTKLQIFRNWSLGYLEYLLTKRNSIQIVPHNFLVIAYPHPNLGLKALYLKRAWFLGVLTVIFGFLVSKTFPIPIFGPLPSLEVKLFTKTLLSKCREFATWRD